jgi:hypothetical protein
VSRDLAEPPEARTSGGDVDESRFLDKPLCLVEHVYPRMPQPCWTGVPTPWAGVKLGDQEPSTGLEHPVHLLDRSSLIVLGYMVEREGARDGAEGGIGKRQVLCEGDLEGTRHAPFACLAAGAVDHLDCCINAVNRPSRCYPLRKDAGKAARAAADVEDLVTGPKLQIISQHRAQTVSAPAKQAVPQVVNTRPVNEPVSAVVTGMAGGMDHRHVSVRRPPRQPAWRVRRIDQDPSFLRIDADILRP